MATLTQQNARLNWCLEKAPVWECGAPGEGQTNASGSIPSPCFSAGNLLRQNATPLAEEMRKTMRSIKDIWHKHQNNGGMAPLRSNCNKEVSMLNNILMICGLTVLHRQLRQKLMKTIPHIFLGVQGGNLEHLGKALQPFLSGLGVVWQIKTEHEQRTSRCSSQEENDG